MLQCGPVIWDDGQDRTAVKAGQETVGNSEGQGSK